MSTFKEAKTLPPAKTKDFLPLSNPGKNTKKTENLLKHTQHTKHQRIAADYENCQGNYAQGSQGKDSDQGGCKTLPIAEPHFLGVTPFAETHNNPSLAPK